ncbi:site-2 protease family protein [Clostridium carnis]
MRGFLLSTILTVPAILIAFTAQGYARAKVADKLGDKTPRFQGRLTLNPAAHIDLVGFIMILFIGFGWTKPVDTNPNAYKRGYKDAIKVTVAAPLANLLVGFIFTIIFVFFAVLTKNILPSTFYAVGCMMIKFTAVINVNLFVFNLLPLPGLAGFEIFKQVSPRTFYKVADILYQYQMIILLGVILVGQYILRIPSELILNLFSSIASFILRIFI